MLAARSTRSTVLARTLINSGTALLPWPGQTKSEARHIAVLDLAGSLQMGLGGPHHSAGFGTLMGARLFNCSCTSYHDEGRTSRGLR